MSLHFYEFHNFPVSADQSKGPITCVPIARMNLAVGTQPQTIADHLEELRDQGRPTVLFADYFLVNEIRDATDLLALHTDGVPTAAAEAWLEPLGDELRSRGIVIDLLMADNEEGVGYDRITAGISDPDARLALLEPYVELHAAALYPTVLEDFRTPGTAAFYDAYFRFNAVTRAIKDRAMRRAALASGVLPIRPGAILNWQTTPAGLRSGGSAMGLAGHGSGRAAWPLDHNGHRLAPGIIGNVASPVCYLGETGSLMAGLPPSPGVSSPARTFRALLACWNNAALCCDHRDLRIVPMISGPRFYSRDNPNAGQPNEPPVREGYDDVNIGRWAQMFRGLIAMGIREFSLWNYDGPNFDGSTGRAWVLEILENLEAEGEIPPLRGRRRGMGRRQQRVIRTAPLHRLTDTRADMHGVRVTRDDYAWGA